MLNKLWNLNLPFETLESIGARLGADVPFLVRGGTAFAEGIGERLTFVDPLELPEGAALLIATPLLLNPEAYFNAFEISVFPTHPLVAEMKQKFIELGAEVALKSGSGASVFGIFKSKDEAEKAAIAMKQISRYQTVTKFWHR